jgi:Carboxypeptidase regulatory-like domain/TonB-dependent Receptor Plug Domain
MAISRGVLTRGPAICALLAASAVAGAQTQYASLVGVVRDSAGHPIPSVEVRLRGSSEGYTRTDDSGGFRLLGLPAGAVSVTARRLGFAPASMEVKLRAGHVDSLVLSLTATVAAIEGVLVEDEYDARSHRLLAGFWDRRSHGFGNFVTRDEIEKRDPHDFVDVVRMMPSVRVETRNGRNVIRLSHATLRDCPPQYWVDGLRIEAASPDEFVPQDVEAVEVYSGPATIPPQFTARVSSNTCGAIVIWTRIPG